jgi:indole-3-acetate monooxygenase
MDGKPGRRQVVTSVTTEHITAQPAKAQFSLSEEGFKMTLLSDDDMAEMPDVVTCKAPTEADLLASVTAMAPLVARLQQQIERDRRLPAEIVDALKAARIFGMFVPKRYGGPEIDGPGAVRVVTALSKLDGAVGWNVLISLIGSLVTFLTTPALCDQIFGDGQDHIFAGSNRPSGSGVRVTDGWHVSGVWPFASGCENADWILGNCVLEDGGTPIPSVSGDGPLVRACLIPAKLWQIQDTWHVFGLKGTGSHHIALHDVFVPDTNFFEFPFGMPVSPEPAFSRVPELMVLLHSAFAVGIAEGAVSDLLTLARSGVTQQHVGSSLAETDRFKEGLARLDAELSAIQALLDADAIRVWQQAEPSKAKDVSRIAGLRGHAAWIASACVGITDRCFEFAGGDAVYDSSPFQRRMRDLRVGAQHASVHPRNYVSAGAAILSGPV